MTEEEEKNENETITHLDRADQIAQMQKRENDRREDILVREEQLMARKQTGGDTEGGTKEEPEKKETDKEYRARVEKEMAEGRTDFGN